MNNSQRRFIVNFLKTKSRKFSTNFNNHNSYQYFKDKYGERPRFMRRNIRTWPFVLLLSAPTLIFGLYVKYWVRDERENGYSQLAEYKELREQRKKDKQNKEGKIVAHSPTKKKEIDGHFKYILIGAGTASYHALKAIKSQDPEGEVLIIGEEDSVPYSRTPLSKELWKSEDLLTKDLKFVDQNGDLQGIDYSNDEFYTPENHITLLKKTKATKLNVSKKYVILSDGKKYKFDKCLIATGATPIAFAGSESSKKISTFRTKKDFQKLTQIQQGKGSIIVVGGSFLGTELAYSLAKKGCDVTQIYLEQQNLVRNLPRYLGDEIGKIMSEAHVKLVPNSNVVGVNENKDGTVTVKLDTGKELNSHHVVVAVGVYPNTELAEDAGLEIDPVNGGIVTNAELEARNDVFVAGDCLSYHDTVLGRRRSEHHLHASSTGTRAGLNMSGPKKAYSETSVIWSSYGNTEFQAVGNIDPRLDTYGVFNGVSIEQNGTNWYAAYAPVKTSSYKKGVVYYLKDETVVGILMWNLPGKATNAKNLLKQKKKFFSRRELDDEIPLD